MVHSYTLFNSFSFIVGRKGRQADRIRCTVMFEKKQERDGKVQVPVFFTLNGKMTTVRDEKSHFYMDCDKPLFPFIGMTRDSSVLAKVRNLLEPCLNVHVQIRPSGCIVKFSAYVSFILGQKVSITYRNRGYFMAARGYEFYLRVLKVSPTSERNVLFIIKILMKFLHKTQLFLFIFETAK